MQEYENSAPSFVTILIPYALPLVAAKPVGVGKVRVQDACTASTPLGLLHPDPNATALVFLAPAMKKSVIVILATPTFLTVKQTTARLVLQLLVPVQS
jgi:hypothetical protein